MPHSKGTSTRPLRKGERLPRYRFVGGKGGVGKTTCAAAIAVAAASDGQRTLVISTDPAPSLGDALNRPLGAAPRAVPLRRGALEAVEIDAARGLERWLAYRREAFERIALRGTWLDREDVSRLLGLSLPGIDELAALFEIARYGRTGKYDLIVVDTAPTGHTLRMLETPDALRAMASVFDAMQAKHRTLVEALRGGWSPDADDALIAGMDGEGRELAELLRNPTLAHVTWVTLAEPMSIEETADAASALERLGIPLQDLVVNRITQPPERKCRWCDARRSLEARAIAELARRVPRVPMVMLGTRDTEPRGVTALRSVGAELTAAPRAARRPPRAGTAWRARPAARQPGEVLSGIVGDETRLLMFGGKGGVGKTTSAAAAGIALASRVPQRRVLLLSTDPAHSLGDALGAAVTDRAGPVAGGPSNLVAREIDASRSFRDVRVRYAAAIDAVFDRLSRGESPGVGFDAGHDRQVMHALIDLAPPGLDELAAVIDVTDALSGDRLAADLVVMDTAPSGHALRLLEMPALVQGWTRALMAILLKYQPVAGLGDLGAVLLRLSQGLSRLRTLLVDPRRTAFVIVTRAGVLPRAETVRLFTRLRRMGIQVPAILVNGVGRGTCSRCRQAEASDAREIARLRRAARSVDRSISIALAPAEIPPPHGLAGLRRWQKGWVRAGISSKPAT